ncbi:hypothetical protein PMAYCL1PPCAC_18248 [Pristionchus mayeri]|uniref:Uncharacterized protein n=1 Tax=Pristionchus mayeri TaxID=1317129 RepID=A0AAN5CP86_9BILA|nr:hypothetical protein PMAYCL1PPCAC_18248 [Pristionchus mayeri]
MASSMYSLPLYFPPGRKVDPIGVMYNLPSYHGGGETPSLLDADPTKQLETNQLNLIKLLEAFNERIDKHLNGLKGEKKKEGKDSKKEEKGEICAEKESMKKEKGGKAVPAKPPTLSTTPWKLMEEKVGAEAANGISACALPSLARYPNEKLGKVNVTVTSADIFWMENLAKVASKREVKFCGEVKNEVMNGNVEVVTKKGASFSLEVDSFSCVDRVTGWKILGGAIGLFSFHHLDAVQNEHTHRWLTRLAEVIEGGKRAEEVSSLLSSCSQFLSRFDSLSSHCSLSLADTLVRPLFLSNLPNNVELWAKRLESVI